MSAITDIMDGRRGHCVNCTSHARIDCLENQCGCCGSVQYVHDSQEIVP